MAEGCGAPAPLQLPDELWARVLAACDYAEVVRMLCCSRQLRRLGDAPEVWRRLCAAHNFGGHPPRGGVQDWKTLFRDRRVPGERWASAAARALTGLRHLPRSTTRMRRELRLSQQRRVLRAESAIAVRRANEARLRGEIADEQRRRTELLQLAAQATEAQAAEAAGRRARTLWLPSAVRDAADARAATAVQALPRHAAAMAAQELKTSEARLRQLAATLRATQAQAPRHEADLAAAVARGGM
jgi:signal transduction histidine kinase